MTTLRCPACGSTQISTESDSWECGPCGCSGPHGETKWLRESHAKLLAACKEALHCLTEDVPESQEHPESPYHFLFAALAFAEPTEPVQ